MDNIFGFKYTMEMAPTVVILGLLPYFALWQSSTAWATNEVWGIGLL